MFAVTRLRVGAGDEPVLAEQVRTLLAALATRPGFLDGEIGSAPDEPGLWALVTRWEGVGSYRRALSAYDVKLAGGPVWVHAVDEPGVYLTAADLGTEA
ncbi:antibiotic biosynthesis monooxygenase [Blastococcus sp. TBT05-19]|uniref:antibiotic biosynthesis monooxygenase family protein n=1 Tax=Blastococcus sp. TBT05-19 TaxID=2250581 RepID=UPI000DE80D2F|nr:antibiotic biosynthesis monooxygenase [Blastococcus sp. TBT05-19]RBY94784.1 antibiotic biosynthesis monooxygenase [Blastococcus sp. TBT05-19]